MFKCLILNVDRGGLIKRGVGAYRIAHVLRENNWDAEVIEFALQWSLDQLKQLALQRIDNNLKFVGISALFMDEQAEVLDSFLAWLKKEWPHLKIIIGGPGRYRFDNRNIDYNVHGFGENALLALLKYLYSNGPIPKFSMHLNSGRNIDANEMYPSFPMKSLMVKYEDRDFIRPDEWLGVEFARGCKFSCDFCNFPVLGVKGDYTRDAEDFRIQMQDAYDRFGVTNYYSSDETFNDRTEKITKFADVVETLPFTPYFTGFIRPDLLIGRDGDREELLRMNFLGHFYGIETFYHQSGKAIGKGMHPDKVKQGLIDVRKLFEGRVGKKFRATISLIAGLPHEPIESLYTTKQWLIDNWVGQSFSCYSLQIPLSEFIVKSKMSKDWGSYGYRNAEKDPDMVQYLASRSAINFKTSEILIWKNDMMSIKDADDVARDIENIKNTYDFKHGNYALIRTGLGSLEERLEFSDNGKPLPSATPEIESYIEKKLGL